MKLSIVIPAYNEEQAIAAIIERTLAARDTITQISPVDAVEIIVVSDGSTDRTADIAAQYRPDIHLIVFDRNRGYGAAIKRGFEESTGDVVGFLDADGTCDPSFCANLCTALAEENAAVAIGSRMGPDSRMPKLRRLGNRIYAVILSALSNRVVTDTASGMRVIRRDALDELYPLPDGLHFTPAMSARILMDDRLRIVEQPMPYEERVGASKLSVVKDGVRFLRTILDMTLMWKPQRLFVAGAAICVIIMTLLAMYPTEMWLRTGHLREDMTYRLLTCLTLGTLGATLLCAGMICHHVHRLLDRRAQPPTFLWSLLDRLYSARGLLVVTTLAVPALLWLIGRGVWTYLIAGYVADHWSRVMLAGLVVLVLSQTAITSLIITVLRFHTARSAVLRCSDHPSVRALATVTPVIPDRPNAGIQPAPQGRAPLVDATAP